MGDPNPIETSKTYENAFNTLKEKANEGSLAINVQNELNNIDAQILLKKEQLIKMKNEKLNNQIKELQNYESSIINKDRLIDETNANMKKNSTNIIIISISIILSLILLLIVSLYIYGKLNGALFNIIFIVLLFCYIILCLYGFNWFYFRNIANFFNILKNDRLEKSVKDWGKFTKTDLQRQLYGDRKEWDEKNCTCVEEEKIYSDEANVSVKNIPGYFYYDGNAPKQLIIGNDKEKIVVGGTPINSGTEEKPIYDKIEWVDHDKRNNDEIGIYELNRKNNKLNILDSALVGNSTFTTNL